MCFCVFMFVLAAVTVGLSYSGVAKEGGKAPRIIQTKRKYTSELHKIWPILSAKNNENRCYQISFFKAKMHQI